MMPGAKRRNSRHTVTINVPGTATGGGVGTATRPGTGGKPTNKGPISHNAANANKRRRNFLDVITSTGEAPPLAPDNLIPIRIDVTVDGHRVQDTFSWNADERTVTPQVFAALLVSDLSLPSSATAEIANQINEQISAHLSAVPSAALSPASSPKQVISSAQPGRATTLADSLIVRPASVRRGKESRHVVRLDVRIGRIVVRDQFEWDMSETDNNPDTFAERLCADLGLNTEHVGAIAYAIRTQLCELSQFQDRRTGCAIVTEESAVRDNVEGWSPAVQRLSLEEQQKLERKEIREARLQRRNRGKMDATVYSRPSARVAKSRSGRRRLSRQSQ